MKCPFCGREIPNGAHFCASCGNSLAGRIVQTPPDNPMYAQPGTNVRLNFSKNDRLVSDDEYVIATLENGVVDNIISGEGFKSEDAVLTNKRLYYNHKEGIFSIRTQEEKVNVKDITGSKIARINPIGIVILAVLVLVIFIINAIAFEELAIMLISIPVLLFLLCIYLLTNKSYFKIEYAGGEIIFSLRKYGKENIRNFQKCIYIAKDRIEDNK